MRPTLATAVAPLACCALAGLAASGVAGCRALDRQAYYALIDGGGGLIEGGGGDTTGDREAGTDATVRCAPVDDGGAVAGDGGCNPYRIPARPAALTDVPGGGRTRVFALRRVMFGIGSRALAASIGFDRDNRCSSPVSPDPMPGCMPQNGTTSEDGERGRDNAFATVAAAFASGDWNEVLTNDGVSSGAGTAGLRVTEYGDNPNDARVVLEWLPLIHGHASTGTADRPRFDGRDVWSVDRLIAYDPTAMGRALVRSENAFVTCGTLVAPLPARVPLRFNTPARTIRLTISGGYFVGPIAPDGSSIGPLEFSGYWIERDALDDLGSLGLCAPPVGNAMAWSLVRNAVENATDLLSTGETAPAVQCDAISVAFRAELVPITLGADMDGPRGVEAFCVPPDAGARD